METKFVGLTSTQVLGVNTVLRITVVDADWFLRDLATPLPLIDTRAFARRLNDFWASLASLGMGYPVSPNPAIKDATVGVIDFRLRTQETAATLLRALETKQGVFMRVSEISKLSEAQAKVAAGDRGAQQREAVKAVEQQRQDAPGPVNKFMGDISRTLGTSLTVVKYLAIVALFIGLIYVASKTKRAASTKLSW